MAPAHRPEVAPAASRRSSASRSGRPRSCASDSRWVSHSTIAGPGVAGLAPAARACRLTASAASKSPRKVSIRESHQQPALAGAAAGETPPAAGRTPAAPPRPRPARRGRCSGGHVGGQRQQQHQALVQRPGQLHRLVHHREALVLGDQQRHRGRELQHVQQGVPVAQPPGHGQRRPCQFPGSPGLSAGSTGRRQRRRQPHQHPRAHSRVALGQPAEGLAQQRRSSGDPSFRWPARCRTPGRRAPAAGRPPPARPAPPPPDTGACPPPVRPAGSAPRQRPAAAAPPATRATRQSSRRAERAPGGRRVPRPRTPAAPATPRPRPGRPRRWSPDRRRCAPRTDGGRPPAHRPRRPATPGPPGGATPPAPTAPARLYSRSRSSTCEKRNLPVLGRRHQDAGGGGLLQRGERLIGGGARGGRQHRRSENSRPSTAAASSTARVAAGSRRSRSSSTAARPSAGVSSAPRRTRAAAPRPRTAGDPR